MKILVTGASGFVGSHLCRRLHRDGYELSILRRAASDISLIADLPLTHHIGDVTDADSVARALQGHDAVIHAAAHLSYWRQLRETQTQINVGGTQNVAAACARHGVRLVHVSSVAAIGIPNNPARPADETFRFNLEHSGLNYHISKKRAEEVVLGAVAQGLNAVIVNPASGYGAFGKRYRGGEVPSRVQRSRLITYFVGGINAVHVEDVADGIVAALLRGRRGERYILGGENCTWRAMGVCVAQLLGVRRIFVPVPPPLTALLAAISEPLGRMRQQRPRFTFDVHYTSQRYHFYDSTKARVELGYRPRTYEQIVRDFLAWQAARPTTTA